ncbi:MAG: hypothetical protein Fur0032_17990 [Terrimicrobiaceae bacterium]
MLAGDRHGVEERSQSTGLEFFSLKGGVSIGKQADAKISFQPGQGFDRVGKQALPLPPFARKNVGERAGIFWVVEELVSEGGFKDLDSEAGRPLSESVGFGTMPPKVCPEALGGADANAPAKIVAWPVSPEPLCLGGREPGEPFRFSTVAVACRQSRGLHGLPTDGFVYHQGVVQIKENAA